MTVMPVPATQHLGRAFTALHLLVPCFEHKVASCWQLRYLAGCLSLPHVSLGCEILP